MKILIVSDTHRKDENLKWVIRKTKPFDMLIIWEMRKAVNMRS